MKAECEYIRISLPINTFVGPLNIHFNFLFLNLFLIEGKLLYNTVLVSTKHIF